MATPRCQARQRRRTCWLASARQAEIFRSCYPYCDDLSCIDWDERSLRDRVAPLGDTSPSDLKRLLTTATFASLSSTPAAWSAPAAPWLMGAIAPKAVMSPSIPAIRGRVPARPSPNGLFVCAPRIAIRYSVPAKQLGGLRLPAHDEHHGGRRKSNRRLRPRRPRTTQRRTVLLALAGLALKTSPPRAGRPQDLRKTSECSESVRPGGVESTSCIDAARFYSRLDEFHFSAKRATTSGASVSEPEIRTMLPRAHF